MGVASSLLGIKRPVPWPRAGPSGDAYGRTHLSTQIGGRGERYNKWPYLSEPGMPEIYENQDLAV